jgi:hypothetical protein
MGILSSQFYLLSPKLVQASTHGMVSREGDWEEAALICALGNKSKVHICSGPYFVQAAKTIRARKRRDHGDFACASNLWISSLLSAELLDKVHQAQE